MHIYIVFLVWAPSLYIIFLVQMLSFFLCEYILKLKGLKKLIFNYFKPPHDLKIYPY